MNHVLESAAPCFSREEVESVLDELRPYVHRHGGELELVGLDGPNVRVRLRGACTTCPSSSVTLRAGVETRLREELPGFGELLADIGDEPRAPRRWWRFLG